MEKIKALIKWIGVDGLLHFLVCYAMMLTLTPIIGVWWTLGTTLFVALAKEAYDVFIKKSNTLEHVIHDLIMDAGGILFALIFMLLWWVCTL